MTAASQPARVSSRHDWRAVGGTFDWHLYKCRRCGREAFPTPFGFMPFWKRCRPLSSPTPSQNAPEETT